MAQPHAVILPYDEHGHVAPAFSLGCALALTGVRVTLVLTATRYAATRMHSMPCDACLFRVVPISDTGSCNDAGKQDDVSFQHSLQKLEPALQDFLLQMQPRPSCLISDIIYAWANDLADRLGLPCFHFCVHPAIAVLLGFQLPALVSRGLLPFQPGTEDEVIDFIPGLPQDFRLKDVPVDFLARDSKHLEVVSRVRGVLKRAAGTVINSARVLEPDVMDALSREGFTMYAVGPMSSMHWKETGKEVPYVHVEDDGCILWLDQQPRGAVVYVAVGTLVSLTDEEIREVAFGLEACGQPFLWVLRHPRSGDIDPISALPDGFEERTKERGRVIRWAPQMAVLAHASVGCFLSHCGMSSVLEAVWAGVPMIGGFTKVSDQNVVCRLATKEWGVAVALDDDPPNDDISSCAGVIPLRRSVEMWVKEVIHGEKGRALSEKALQLKDVVRKAVEPNGSAHLSFLKLVDALHACIPNNAEA